MLQSEEELDEGWSYGYISGTPDKKVRFSSALRHVSATVYSINVCQLRSATTTFKFVFLGFVSAEFHRTNINSTTTFNILRTL